MKTSQARETPTGDKNPLLLCCSSRLVFSSAAAYVAKFCPLGKRILLHTSSESMWLREPTFEVPSTEVEWWFSATSVHCCFWVALVAGVSMSVFPCLSSLSGLSDITAVPMSSPQRFWSGVSILSWGCSLQHTSYSGTTPGAGLERHFWELISHAASAAEVTVLNKLWGLEVSVCCFGLFMYADTAGMQPRALLSKSAWKIDTVSKWRSMHWKLFTWQAAGTQTCWSTSETKGNRRGSPFCQ